MDTHLVASNIPWFGARKLARQLSSQVQRLATERDQMRQKMDTLGVLSLRNLNNARKPFNKNLTTSESKSREKSATRKLR
jgi:hypothetical protein